MGLALCRAAGVNMPAGCGDLPAVSLAVTTPSAGPSVVGSVGARNVTPEVVLIGAGVAFAAAGARSAAIVSSSGLAAGMPRACQDVFEPDAGTAAPAGDRIEADRSAAIAARASLRRL